MFKRLYPKEYISSVYDLDFKKFYDEGYRAILFDVDNTLVPHNAPADNRAKRLFSDLNFIGFKTVMISNNKEPRVRIFCNAVNGYGYIFKANKPSDKGYIKAMTLCGTTPSNTLFIGDQIFTDILGANNAGVYSILVKPVLKWREEPQIILKRFLEAVVLLFYKFHKKSKEAV